VSDYENALEIKEAVLALRDTLEQGLQALVAVEYERLQPEQQQAVWPLIARFMEWGK